MSIKLASKVVPNGTNSKGKEAFKKAVSQLKECGELDDRVPLTVREPLVAGMAVGTRYK